MRPDWSLLEQAVGFCDLQFYQRMEKLHAMLLPHPVETCQEEDEQYDDEYSDGYVSDSGMGDEDIRCELAEEDSTDDPMEALPSSPTKLCSEQEEEDLAEDEKGESNPSENPDLILSRYDGVVREAVLTDCPDVLGYVLQQMSEEMILGLQENPPSFGGVLLPPPSSRITAFLLATKGVEFMVCVCFS